MNKQVPQSIAEYIKSKVTVNTYEEELPLALGYRSHRGMTQLFQNPEKATAAQVSLIATFTNTDPNFLIDTYKLGIAKLTISQRNEFLKSSEIIS